MNRTPAIAASIAFLACIVAANYATATYGLVPVGFGLYATAGTLFAGLTFVLRDTIHDNAGRLWVLALIVIGATISLALAPAQIAIASGVAFLISELADMAVYTPLRRRGYIRAAIASNVVGALVDTVVFLAIAGFPIWTSLPGQMLVKLTVTTFAVLVIAGIRAVSRQPVRV